MTTLPITRTGLPFAVSSFSVPVGLSIAELANGETAVAWQDGVNAAMQVFSANGAPASLEVLAAHPAAATHSPTRMSSRSPTAISS